MKLDVEDLKRLQWALAFLVIMAVVGAASVWTTHRMLGDSDKALKAAATARKDIQTKLSRAREEEQDLREKIGRFLSLKEKGYIGPEKRLDWIETLARIKTERRILKLDYEFTPQRPVDATILAGGSSAGGFEIMASRMMLQLHLVHEGELMTFLADLRAQVQALIQVRSCEIERLTPTTTDRSRNAQLKAECTLEWITLKEGK
jgi:hypothetical protein